MNKVDQLVDELNQTFKDFGDIFVASLKIESINYYYDKELDKIKVKTYMSHRTNNDIFLDNKVQNSFCSFIQTVADKFNEEFTQVDKLGILLENALKEAKNS